SFLDFCHQLGLLPQNGTVLCHHLQHFHHVVSKLSIAPRLSSGLGTMNKVLDLGQQRFGVAEMWRNDIPGTIAELELTEVLRHAELDSAIINLYLLAGLGVVIHDHALRAGDTGATHFLRRQPADFDRSDYPTGESQPDESYIVFVALHASPA